MSRRRWLAVALSAAVLSSPHLAYAEDEQVATEQCVVLDPRIVEGSGLVATEDGYRIVNDGGEHVTVFRLDHSCAVTGTTEAAIDPYDVEDLALGPDGSLWLADIGDNRIARASVAIIVVPDEPGAVTGALRRLQYPDGPRDAESMIVDDEGRAIVLTKTFSGVVGVYRSQPIDLSPDGSTAPQPLEKLGEFQLPETGTAGGPLGPPLDNLMATGAARCADTVALRTYTDVHVWRGADPATAILTEPVATAALPVQQQGESVAFTRPSCDAVVVHGEGSGVPIHRVALPHHDDDDSVLRAPTAAESPAATNRTEVVIVLAGALAAAGLLLTWLLRRRRPGR